MDILKVKLWNRQAEALESLLKPPFRTLIKSGHSLGKTFLSACAVCWFFDTRYPSAVITTAPTARDVRDLLWKEVRLLRIRNQLDSAFSGTMAPLLQDAPNHFAKGFTSQYGDSFQGRHEEEMLFLFDESVGIAPIFWETTNTMFQPGGKHAWLCTFNPTDTTSRAYIEEGLQLGDGAKWRTIQMSALDHPNIAQQLRGEKPDYPAAVTLPQIWDAIHEGCLPVTDERRITDFQFPPPIAGITEGGAWWQIGRAHV